jgi:hypothetical protein
VKTSESKFLGRFIYKSLFDQDELKFIQKHCIDLRSKYVV